MNCELEVSVVPEIREWREGEKEEAKVRWGKVEMIQWTERIDELEGREKGKEKVGWRRDLLLSDESGERWRWDGRAWWHRVECKGPLNSRLRRRVSRAVSVALEQESKRWRQGLVRLRERVDWLESR